jgi:hypothetical protein
VDEDNKASGTALGASITDRNWLVQIYLPQRDMHGRPVETHAQWVRRAETLFGKLFGGATRPPDCNGVWVNPDNDQEVREPTSIVYSYTSAEKLEAGLTSLKMLVHLFGRETNQGEVAILVGQVLLGITEYDSNLNMAG